VLACGGQPPFSEQAALRCLTGIKRSIAGQSSEAQLSGLGESKSGSSVSKGIVWTLRRTEMPVQEPAQFFRR